MKFLNLILFVLFFSFTAFSQSSLSNDDVIEMVKTGLSEGIIVAKIKVSETKFDVATPALKALADAKVPESVIVAMVEKEQLRQQESATTRGKIDESRNAIPEQGALTDILGKRRVYILTKDIKSRDLISKVLDKTKNFEVVDKIENSDFVIRYESWVEEIGATGNVYGNTATVRRQTQIVGTFDVLMPALDGNPNRIRTVYSTKKEKYFVWTDNPAESTTKQFLKDLAKTSTK